MPRYPRRLPRLRTLPATLVLAALATSVACGDPAPYRLGIVLDDDGMQGASLAVEQVNAGGGIGGRRLELRREAASRTARLALDAADVLAADARVLAVIGHTNSSASLAASQAYNARRVVQIAPTSTAPLYSQAGEWSFRLVASDLHQGRFLAEHVLSMAPRRVVVVYVNDDYGRSLHKVFSEHVRAQGLSLLLDAPYSEGTGLADLKELVASVVPLRPELLVWIGRTLEFVAIVPGLMVALPELRVVASDGLSGLPASGDSAFQLRNAQYISLLDFARRDTALAMFRQRYLGAGRGEPTDEAVLAFDSVMLIADAIRKSGAERDAIRRQLSSVGRESPAFAGLSGSIAFTEDGDRTPQYFLRDIHELLGPVRAPAARPSGLPVPD